MEHLIDLNGGFLSLNQEITPPFASQGAPNAA
jgi:hypothetical protein